MCCNFGNCLTSKRNIHFLVYVLHRSKGYCLLKKRFHIKSNTKQLHYQAWESIAAEVRKGGDGRPDGHYRKIISRISNPRIYSYSWSQYWMSFMTIVDFVITRYIIQYTKKVPDLYLPSLSYNSTYITLTLTLTYSSPNLSKISKWN